MKQLFLVILFLGLMGVKGAWATELFSFSGHIDLSDKTWEGVFFSDQKKVVQFNIHQVDEDQFNGTINFDHFRFFIFDLSSILELNLAMDRNQNDEIVSAKGKFRSSYSILNYQPITELTGDVEIREDVVFIHALEFGRSMCRGTVGLASPHKSELNIQLREFELRNFLALILRLPEVDASGLTQGDVHIRGSLEAVALDGRIISEAGNLSDLDFDKLDLIFNGIYPLVNLAGSTVIQTDGLIFNLDGVFDLDDQEHLDLQFEQIAKRPFVSEASKGSEWTLKRISSEEKKGTTEFKYLRRKDNPAFLNDDEPEGEIRLERRVEF